MKRFLNCNQSFSEDNDFCPDDGTVLVAGDVGFRI